MKLRGTKVLQVRPVAAAVAAFALAFAAAPSAHASPSLRLGFMDEEQTLWAGDPAPALANLQDLRAQVLRTTLYWNAVAPERPDDPADPADPAYNWSEYDRLVLASDAHGIRLLFTILATPAWANGGRSANYAPASMADLWAFSLAAARRYSGTYTRGDRTLLPQVNMWSAWNEPNLRRFLAPQWRKVGNRYVIASGPTYARICNAIWRGVHAAGKEAGVRETVACGETAPRARFTRLSTLKTVAPIPFLRSMKRAGARFDVYAHHPYSITRPPTWRPPASLEMVSLGNIDVLVRELDRLYGRRTRLWITEYGYRTNPPDPWTGVSWAKQATYLKQAYEIVRRHPRIDLLVLFLLRDQALKSGWASGLISADERKKPAYWAVRNLPR